MRGQKRAAEALLRPGGEVRVGGLHSRHQFKELLQLERIAKYSLRRKAGYCKQTSFNTRTYQPPGTKEAGERSQPCLGARFMYKART